MIVVLNEYRNRFVFLLENFEPDIYAKEKFR